VVVLALCVGGLTAVAMQVRCVDAAREAARLAARGNERVAVETARRVAPVGAWIQLRRDGDFFTAMVAAHSKVLPGLVIAAKAVSAAEPSG
jgi:hypothetical protein